MNNEPKERQISKDNKEKKPLKSILREKADNIKKIIGEEKTTLYSHRAIAECLDISVELLRKKIYKFKPITRDFIIALCAAYGLDDDETDYVLGNCDMHPLDADNVRRDDVIFDFLDDNCLKCQGKNFKPTHINTINEYLIKNNCDPLIIERRNKKNIPILQQAEHKESFNISFKTFEYEDRYESISTKYYPHIRCEAETIINDKEKKYLLLYSKGMYFVKCSDETLPIVFNDVNDTKRFKQYFIELYNEAKKKERELDNVLFDTKNYNSGRYGANIKNDRIHVFYEIFNYTFPERNEYYLMEYVDGKFLLSISNKSMFMQEYLSPDDFKKHYKHLHIGIRESYSYDELVGLVESNKKPQFYPDIDKHRKNVFSRLQCLVAGKVDELRNNTVFINNLKYIYDNPYDILKYYKIEKEFKCKYDKELGEICSASKIATFKNKNNEAVRLSFDDIKRAFELGFSDIDQIIRVKCQRGEIDEIFS